jgi:polar amino acid transport system substrate-binding protein
MQQSHILNKCFLFRLLIIFIPSLSLATTPLIITSGRGEPFVNAQQTGFYDLIVKHMFQRINITATTVLLPSQRSLINANTGINDGNIARIKGLEKKFPNLAMVPEKIIDFDFVAFTKNKQLKVSNWESLKPYNIAFINGWKAFEKKATHYKSLVRTRDSEQLFNLLNNNRVDLVLYDLWSGAWWIQQANSEIDYLRPPIASYQLYLYIHKKHKHLLPGLAKSLRDMKQDGTYQKIYDTSLNSLLKSQSK